METYLTQNFLKTKFSYRWKKKIITETITSTFHKKECVAYEKTDEHMLRSVNVYYSMGVMRKRNIKVLQSLSFNKVDSKFKKTTRIKLAKCSIPVRIIIFFSGHKGISTKASRIIFEGLRTRRIQLVW